MVGTLEGGEEEEALRPFVDKSAARESGISRRSVHNASARQLSQSSAPPSRRATRARRLPAWYKDYDTDYIGAGDESPPHVPEYSRRYAARSDVEHQSTVTASSSSAVGPEAANIPTEEWNVVVYDDEEPMAEQIAEQQQQGEPVA